MKRIALAVSLLVGLACLAPWQAHALKAPVHECDRLAAHPLDGNKVVPGVDFGGLIPDRAIPACEAANRDYPDVPRFKYQYARVLHKAGYYGWALAGC